MELINNISQKIWENQNYKGDTIEEKYMLFYLATTFTIWHTGMLLIDKASSLGSMNHATLIYLFKQSIHITKARLYPTKSAIKKKSA